MKLKILVILIALSLMYVSVGRAGEVWTLIIMKAFFCGGRLPTVTVEFDSQEACEKAKSKIESHCKEIVCVKGGNASVAHNE